MRRAILLPLLLITVLLTSSVLVYAQYQPPHSQPGPATDRVIFRGGVTQETAPLELKGDRIDLYLFNLKTATAKELLDDPDIRLYTAPASSNSIILNPAPAPEGELNPLSIKEVRFALQYIIDRDFIVGEIYRGLAVPMIAHISPFDYDYLTVYDLVRESNIHYEPELAKQLVAEAMTKAGATLMDGKWYYNDKQIRLKFIVRTEDERLDIGFLIAQELDKLGFTVEIRTQQFGPAISTVYGTDPKLFEWHLYTEGWGKTSLEKYDFGLINQMYAPWLGNMPGWQELGFWQYENSELDRIGQKIYMGDFRNEEERNELYRQATRLGIEESVRLWVATLVNNLPAKKELVGITDDLASGPRGLWTLREAYVPDESELAIGHLWVWTERTTWNPVGGFGDIYSVDIWRNVYDPPIWRHPFTGIPIPFRVGYNVETAGPTGTLNVPTDAFMWDVDAKKWTEVGPGVMAKSKVTFNYEKYFNSKWHHGQPITMADVIYNIYQTFDIVYDDDKSQIEFAISTTSKPFLDAFKAFNIVDDDTLEVYVDFWHFVPDYIAEYASVPGLTMPWEILAAMDSLVFEQRRAAYSDTAAARFNVDWLSLVVEGHVRSVVKWALRDFVDKEFFPQDIFTVGGRLFIQKQEAIERYEAAIAWAERYNNRVLVISNGPFKLVAFDSPSQYAELEAFRDSTYPFKPGRWYFGAPSLVQIAKVEGDNIVIGSEALFTIKVQGPGELALKYLLFDPDKGTLLKVGEADRVASDSFEVRLPSSLTSDLKIGGTYQLFLAAYSDEVSMVSERIELVEAVESPLPPTTPTTSPTTTPPTTSPTTPPPPPTEDNTMWLIAGVLVVAAVAMIAFLALRRRGAKGTV